MRKNNTKLIIHSLWIILTAFILVSTLDYFGAFQRAEWISYDWRMKEHRADTKAPEDIAVILIDEASLANLNPLVGRWPWPRSIHADVIDFLAAGEPKAIIFDILFTENERTQLIDNSLSENDLRLAKANNNAPTFHAAQLLSDIKDEVNLSLLDKPLPNFAQKFALALQDKEKINLLHNNNIFSFPYPELNETAKGLGIVNVSPDSDGVFRRNPLVHRYQDAVFPGLSLTALAYPTSEHILNINKGLITLNSQHIPVDPKNQLAINFYGDINTYSMSGVVSSAQSMLNGEIENLIIDPFEFENKIIFIGASAAGVEDLKATSLSSKTPGVMLHAFSTANIINNDFLISPNPLYIFPINLILVVLTVLGTILIKHVRVKVLIPSALLALTTASTFYLFHYNYALPMITPLASIIMAAAFSFTYLVFTEGRDKRRIRTMLAQYVSPAVLTEVVDSYQDILHAEIGREENLSILFSDIRGFTNLSESLPADQLVEILNYYFSSMTDAIFDHEGTIDKFIGDAIMAFWGAPIQDSGHAMKSVIAAIEMTKRLKEVNQWLRNKNCPDISIGIGINTGKVIIGNIGSDRKLDYTVIGDNVNLASRLEGLTKAYGCEIIISEYTYHELADKIPCSIIDTVRVKGKQKPIRVYSPIIHPNKDEAEKIAQQSNSAFRLYLTKDWYAAITAYETIPNPTLRDIFIQRCRRYIATPPPGDWDGVHTMTSK